MRPSVWKESRLGDLFGKRSSPGFNGLPTVSVTLDRGLVRRENLDRKMETTLEPHQHLLVKKGDIAYNMMRMWQGALGLADFDCMVSPAYVVCEPNESKAYSKFFYYLFKSPALIKKFKDSSRGLTEDRLRLYYDDFGEIRIWIPSSVQEQEKIAKILSTWDEAIEKVERLIEVSEVEFSFLLKKTLLDSDLCHSSTLDQIADITMGASPKSSSYNHEGNGLPLIQGNADIKNRRSAPKQFTSEITKECRAGDILFSVRAPVGMVAISEHRACIGRGVAAIRSKRDIFQHSLYFSLLANESAWKSLSQGSTFEAINSSDLRAFEVKIPNEKHIAIIEGLFKSADQAISLLKAKRQSLIRQKQGLMQQLLTGKKRVKV